MDTVFGQNIGTHLAISGIEVGVVFAVNDPLYPAETDETSNFETETETETLGSPYTRPRLRLRLSDSLVRDRD